LARGFDWDRLTVDETKLEIKEGLEQLSDDVAFQIVKELVKEKDWNVDLLEEED